jgi:16S rRNA (guanine1207-N2)-methyltransferase
MQKHMTLGMNATLEGHFAAVRAGLARQKARVLQATGPRPGSGAEPITAREFHEDVGLWICARGGAFAGTDIDIGTRFLLGFLGQANRGATSAVDLGCGTGVLAAALAMVRPHVRVVATDQSAAAVASAVETMRANGIANRVRVLRDDAGSTLPEASVDLVLLNPPFHIGASVHAGAGLALIEAAARLLAPGGELWTVFNSHLGYQNALRRLVGPTRQVGRNAKFTVTASVRSAP